MGSFRENIILEVAQCPHRWSQCFFKLSEIWTWSHRRARARSRNSMFSLMPAMNMSYLPNYWLETVNESIFHFRIAALDLVNRTTARKWRRHANKCIRLCRLLNRKSWLNIKRNIQEFGSTVERAAVPKRGVAAIAMAKWPLYAILALGLVCLGLADPAPPPWPKRTNHDNENDLGNNNYLG